MDYPLAKPTDSIKKVMHVIDKGGLGIAFLVDESKKFVGLVTDGDIRRAILKGVDIKESVQGVMNKKPASVKDGMSNSQIIKYVGSVTKDKSWKVPVLDERGRFVNIVILSEIEEKTGNVQYVTKNDRTPRSKKIKRVLVIGGVGYIGSVLVRKLLKKKYVVRVLDNLMYGDESISDLYDKPNFELFRGDIRNIQDVVRAIIGMDVVIHLAAIVGDPACKIEPITTVETNYIATKMIAEVCKHHQVNRFIFASTCSVYGSGNHLLDETSELNPVSLYAKSKIDSENGILSLVDENFAPTILRMGTLYGLSPRMRFDLVVNILTAKAVKDGEITIFGGEQWRPFLHVSDAADAYISCLEAPIEDVRGLIVNVGSEKQNLKLNDLAKIIKREMPKVKIIVKKKDVDKRDYRVNFNRIHEKLGFKVTKSITDGVREIKEAIDNGLVENYKNKKYHNYTNG